ncbi:putative leucine-rich repeat receptor-like serine/threonine-protein kinase [Glycine soja]|uniref:Putative leucine-rich repeat receptor-like serine/threonine-protein kinase n=1 Tax=Glycine soja TaxID=3848 RepID=A0A445M273_GLYSO|nr:putative leucine-rich repeat receptor-like serine/threonine-protein kinase [Glycine soja]
MIPSFTPGLNLEKDGSKQLVDATLYKQIVGYLCITVPYLANSVGLIRKIIEKWRKPPILVAKRILRLSGLEIISLDYTSYSLYINCGGNLVTDGRKTYDDDTGETTGPASFHNDRGKNWALINNGHFFDTNRLNYYNVTNSTKLVMENVELYMNARVSPTSLTYYGFCLGNGIYTVKLHFAEIMFTDDKTYSSLGRRVFDIYIQRNLVAKDFNIAKEAGGVGKAVIKNFTVVVTSNALEIRLYWAGKGTTSIPFRSVYGPLISAISVDPNFIPPSESGSSSISIIRVVVAVVVAGAIIILIFGILWWKRFLGWERSVGRELKGLESQTSLFTLRQIKAATNNFDKSLKIGEGGFGPVYKVYPLKSTTFS